MTVSTPYNSSIVRDYYKPGYYHTERRDGDAHEAGAPSQARDDNGDGPVQVWGRNLGSKK